MVSYLGKEQMTWYQIACNWSSSLVAADLFSMKSQTTSISSFAPDSKPAESWKIKLLPLYVIWSSISCMPLWQFDTTNDHINISLSNSPQLKVSRVFQKLSVSCLEGTEYEDVHWTAIQLTLLVMYDDGLCSLCYTTDLLKDSCFPCISPSYNKDTKMWASKIDRKSVV